MIINTNEVTLSDSELPLAETMISAHTSTISNNSYTNVKVVAQIGFFLSPEKMLESPTNSLRVQGFEGKKFRLEFNYPTDDTNVFLFFDQKIKEYLLSLYPNWDAEKLVLTTEPVIEE